MTRVFFDCHNQKEGATNIQWAGVADEHPTKHTPTTYNKELHVIPVNSVKVTKPWLELHPLRINLGANDQVRY